MGLDLRIGQSVFIDTAPLIYFWEKHVEYFPKMKKLFDQVYDLNIQCVLSVISYIEITTLPIKQGNHALASKYREYLTNSTHFSVLSTNLIVADKAAHLRATYNLRTPDAIQLATAQVSDVDFVITNDKSWQKVDAPSIVQVGDI